jgi:hypothetical protein
MCTQRWFGYGSSRKASGKLIRARRLERLERAAQLYQQKLARARLRERALDRLSDEELQGLVEWLRTLNGNEAWGETAVPGWQAYQRALEQERGSEGPVKDRPQMGDEPPSRGGGHA